MRGLGVDWCGRFAKFGHPLILSVSLSEVRKRDQDLFFVASKVKGRDVIQPSAAAQRVDVDVLKNQFPKFATLRECPNPASVGEIMIDIAEMHIARR